MCVCVLVEVGRQSSPKLGLPFMPLEQGSQCYNATQGSELKCQEEEVILYTHNSKQQNTVNGVISELCINL